MNDNFGFLDLFLLNKKYFKTIASITVLAFILSIFYSLYSQPLYKSYISIYPTRNENMPLALSGFSNVSSAFGFNFGNESNGYNIPDIINSRKLKKAIATKKWDTNLFDNPIDLINYWEIGKPNFMNKIFGHKEASSAHLENLIIEELSNRISVYEHESGMISISVLMEDELLAANIVNFISNWIQNYISNEMSFKAKKNRVFIEEQLSSAKQDLFLSEEVLSEFLKENSLVDDNPEVMLEKGRLIRNVEVNQEVYITLRKQFELNKIEELKEKPIINILDTGDIPTQKSKPLRSLIVISWTMISFFISNLIVYCYHYYLDNKKSKVS